MFRENSLNAQFLARDINPLTEEVIAKNSPPSLGFWEDVSRCIQIPENVRGLRIMDVGGGASDMTSKLLHLGADAYSIDPRYASMSSLKGLIREQKIIFTNQENRLRNRTLENFKQSTKVNSDRYIEGFATNIPFPNNHFDIVFSRFAILGYLDIESAVLNDAVDEALRVTATGGKLKIFPYVRTQADFTRIVNTARLKNNQVLFDRLKADKRLITETIQIDDLGDKAWFVLEVTKK